MYTHNEKQALKCPVLPFSPPPFFASFSPTKHPHTHTTLPPGTRQRERKKEREDKLWLPSLRSSQPTNADPLLLAKTFFSSTQESIRKVVQTREFKSACPALHECRKKNRNIIISSRGQEKNMHLF